MASKKYINRNLAFKFIVKNGLTGWQRKFLTASLSCFGKIVLKMVKDVTLCNINLFRLFNDI